MPLSGSADKGSMRQTPRRSLRVRSPPSETQNYCSDGGVIRNELILMKFNMYFYIKIYIPIR